LASKKIRGKLNSSSLFLETWHDFIFEAVMSDSLISPKLSSFVENSLIFEPTLIANLILLSSEKTHLDQISGFLFFFLFLFFLSFFFFLLLNKK